MNETQGQEAGRDATPRATERTDDVSVLWLLGIMLRERRTILAFAAVGVVLSLAVGFLRDRTWTAVFSFVPQEGSSAAGLSGLAAGFGISLGSLTGDEQPPEFYADVLVTRHVLEPIATDSVRTRDGDLVPLPELLDVKDDDPGILIEKTLRALRNDVISAGIANRATGIVGVKVRTTSARASLDIAQQLLDGLQRFNTVTRQSQGRAEREFAERRLEEARGALRSAEGDLQGFLEKNRVVVNSPNLTFQRERLEREVSMRQELFTALTQQYEEARLKEVRDTPVITMIDAPVLPARRDSRMLAVILLVGTLAATFAGMLVVLAREAWSRERLRGRDPALGLISREWQSIRAGIRKPKT